MDVTIEMVSAIISKPKMSTKLLSRPPFRFIHDVIMAMNAGNFIEGLLEDHEKDSGAVKEKEAKLAFLDKIILYAGICNGSEISVRSSKIVSGAEPENTNELLQALAKACSDDTIDYPTAVAMTLDGKSPGIVPRKNNEPSEEKHQDRPPPKKQEEPEEKKPEEKRPEEKKPEERKPEKTSKIMAEKKHVETGFDVSRVDGDSETTIELFEGLITKPKLSTKLLSKPPFRFLHDVCTALMKNAKVMDGLFQGPELDSKEIGSKEEKISYLTKVLEFTETCSGIGCEAKANKIVAGLEPENTNRVLQTLALIARNNAAGIMSSITAVQTLLGDKSAPEDKEETHAEEEKTEQVHKVEQVAVLDDEEDEEALDESKSESKTEAVAKSPTARPQTARKRPPKLRDNTNEVNVKVQTPTVAVMMDGQDDSDDSEGENENVTSSNTLRGETDNSGFKSKLVRDILDEEQKESSQQNEEEAKASESTSKTGGITLGKIGRGLKVGGSKTASGAIDVDKVRNAIQQLCQSTNPLGKCMDFVHDDLSIMAKELEKWKSEYRKYCDALEEEQRVTAETVQPLKSKLSSVEDTIKDEINKLASIKSSIARNDQRIAELLRDMVLH